jgi:hypothetical protein
VVVDTELADIIRGGASLLPRTWRAIERCRTDPAPKGELARECGSLVREYTDLSDRARLLPRTDLADRVDRMLTCQMHTVAQASALAFRIHDSRWPSLAARFGDGQGQVSDDLLYLAAQVSLR